MKKKSKLKYILSIASVIFAGIGLFIYFFVPISFWMKKVPMPEPLVADTVLTTEQVVEDRDLMISIMEEAHPYFILEEDLTAYDNLEFFSIKLNTWLLHKVSHLNHHIHDSMRQSSDLQ